MSGTKKTLAGMKIECEGKAIDLFASVAIRFVKYVRGMPDGEVLSLNAVAEKIGASPDRVWHVASKHVLERHQVRVYLRNGTRPMVYGNARTIAELKRRLNEVRGLD